MIQPKNVAAAFALAGMVFAGSIANADGLLNGRFYIEVKAVTADPDDATATFTDDNEDAVWSLSRMDGAAAQIGGDFGFIRTDVKLRALQGDVDSITGTPGGSNITEDDAIIAVGTINIYGEIDFDVSEHFSFTPYIGIGAGYAHGFLQANADGAAIRRTEHRNDGGRASVAMIGALFEVADTIGLTVEYERMDTGLEGQDDIDSVSAGIRLTF